MADPGGQQNQRHKNERAGQEGKLEPVEGETKAHRQGYEDERGGGHAAILDEGGGGEVGEDREDVNQSQPDKGEKKLVGERAHLLAGDFGDRARLVADRGDQGGIIVNPADKDRAEDDPEQRRQPAESDGGDDRADDRSRSRDGGEMVTQQHRLGSWHAVNAVKIGVARSRGRVVNRELPVQKGAVVAPGQQKQQHSGEEDGEQHRLFPLWTAD